MALVCNCRRVVSRGEEYRVVKSRRWDCPSCGLDRKRTLAQMCAEAGATRIVTLTFEQPRVVYRGAVRPGELPGHCRTGIVNGRLTPPDDHLAYLRVDLIPARHAACDSATHIYWNVRHGGWRWRLLPSCAHCCRWVSRAVRLWSLRMRRRWPAFEYLHVREVHKSGAMHLHVAVTGVPKSLTRKSADGGTVREQWRAVGGGFVDVGRHGDHAGSGAGWYVGKYLAKRQDDGGFAKGYRRWSRTGRFAPEVRMVPPRDPDYDGGWHDVTAALVVGGWVHPDGVERVWRWDHDLAEITDAARQLAAQRRLDASTAKCTLSLAVRLQEACSAARVSALAPVAGPDANRPAWEALALL